MTDFNHKKLGFIGAGKLGVSLGAYLRGRGIAVAGYASRNPDSARKAALLTSASPYTVAELAAECEIILITTPDDQIAKVWDELTNYDLTGRIICHTSGLLTSGLFAGIAQKGAFGYSIHPMYAFADADGRADGLKNAYFTIEGDPAYLEELKHLLTSLGNKVLVIERDRKPLYHLACVMATNLLLALVSLSRDLLADCGALGDAALEALMPLIENNLNNIKNRGIVDSLTGPVERNDPETILSHLRYLPPRYAGLYQALSLRLVDLAMRKHPDRDYTFLRNCLENQSTC